MSLRSSLSRGSRLQRPDGAPDLPIGYSLAGREYGHHACVADLWLISHERSDKLTDAETVRLGRQLIESSASARVSYPESSKATAIVHDFTGSLSPKALARASEIFGAHDEEVRGG